jgi:hypothetical protein
MKQRAQSNQQGLFRTCTVGVRFNPVQRGLIWPGLNRIVFAYITFRETGSADGYPFRVHPLATVPRPGLSPGRFKAEFMEMIIDLWTRMKTAKSRRIRLHLNFLQLSACILAVRIGKDYDRVRLKRKISIERQQGMRRVISSLERELKRARRAYAAEMGEDMYKHMRTVWLQQLRWIRMNLVYFRPIRVKTQRRKVARMIIDYGYERARAGLFARDLVPPEERDLRRLVRLAVRYIRRGRIRLFIQNLMTNPTFAAEFFANFIEERRDLQPVPLTFPN